MMTTPLAAVAARGPNARSTRPLSPPGMKSVQLSRSRRRTASPMSVAAKTIHGPALPAVSRSTPPAKNAAKASSGRASAAARDAEVNDRDALAGENDRNVAPRPRHAVSIPGAGIKTASIEVKGR